MNGDTLVGTCGFAGAHRESFRDFRLVEIQQTFYQPPRLTTVLRWRAQAPDDFVFTLKAWQLLTHEATSPTYRRLKEALPEGQLAQAGGFRWNPLTRMAWDRTGELAEALQAEAILFQTPPSFVPSDANLRQLYRFFDTIDRQGWYMVFEPRGETWTDEILGRVMADLRLVPAVDPFLRPPVGSGMRYFRLHGRPAYHYRYAYSDAELSALRGMLSPIGPNRVLFNNACMAEDAKRFMRLLTTKPSSGGGDGPPGLPRATPRSVRAVG